MILGLTYLSRLHAYHGRVSNAFETALEVNAIIQGFGVKRMNILTVAYIANLQLYTGQEGVATQWAAEYQAIRTEQPHEFADLTLVSVLLKQARTRMCHQSWRLCLSEGRLKVAMEPA